MECGEKKWKYQRDVVFIENDVGNRKASIKVIKANSEPAVTTSEDKHDVSEKEDDQKRIDGWKQNCRSTRLTRPPDREGTIKGGWWKA